MARKVTESSGNIFLDLGFPPHEAEVMLLRVSEITRGKVELLSLDYLVGLCAKAGLTLGLRIAA